MNILIVDDEPLIHRSIEFIIRQFKFLDITISHAYNASEMYTYLKQHNIELAFVDIRMPGANGLSAIAQAKNLSYDTLYFIMSGYSEFDYAREAITIGVEEYLLKPLNDDTLRRVINSVREKHKHIIEQRKNTIRGWLHDVIDRRECRDEALNRHAMAAIYVSDDHSTNSEGIWVPKLYSKFEEYIVSCPASDGVLFMMYAPREEYINEVLNTNRKATIPHEMTMYISKVYSDPAEFRDVLQKMLDFAGVRILLGIGMHYQFHDIINSNTGLLDYVKDCLYWKDCFHTGDCLAYLSACPPVYRPIYEGSIPDTYIENIYAFIACVLEINTIELSLPKRLRSMMEHAGNDMIKKQNSTDRIDMILKYINENFCTDISIASISERFGITPNYLSTLLNNKLGIKFADYLSDLRIIYAKELLANTNLRVKDIMEKVGYYSQSHFNKLFVEKVGVTPSAYRKIL
ncbi:response regulator transcription factor [Sediminispirochaeta bajacaliforniensis]|uniref:response regulator transcription factor n=1 Tax=Sediminispirochaeta bajacaliforniensis TaxID=148 RepID=UPI00035F4C21|nr:helix-turn-helix domain-containing protein [Sediminispirochaeta bajacaliforniensis]